MVQTDGECGNEAHVHVHLSVKEKLKQQPRLSGYSDGLAPIKSGFNPYWHPYESLVDYFDSTETILQEGHLSTIALVCQ